jgi:NAD(P)H-dependent flavin oxidoreductase YrpB (nitropropane dioxygenase family)
MDRNGHVQDQDNRVAGDKISDHRNLKNALCDADELSTDLIMFTVGFTHRVWMNEPARKTLEIEKRGGTLQEILPYVSGEAARKMYMTGDLNAGTISVSQAIGIPKKIMPVKDIVEEMIEQARAIHKRMASIGMAG